MSGCGKSTLGSALASALSIPFIDADKLHPPANVAKMSAGQPLTDADREPWLVRVRNEAYRAVNRGQGKGVVVACSALKRSYRDILRGERVTLEGGVQDEQDVISVARQDDSFTSVDAVPKSAHSAEHAAKQPSLHASRTFFVLAHGSRDVLLSRMQHRQNHFMKAGMLDSQLSTLEDPTITGEQGIVRVSIEETTEVQVRQALGRLQDMDAFSIVPGTRRKVSCF